MKMVESSPEGQKTQWKKEKLLVTINFSFSLSVFKRLVLQTRKNQALFGKGLNTMHCRLLMTLEKMPFENIVRKRVNSSNQHFLLFPQCFLLNSINEKLYQLSLNQNCFPQIYTRKLGKAKILSSSKGLSRFPSLKGFDLTLSHTITPFDTRRKQAF